MIESDSIDAMAAELGLPRAALEAVRERERLLDWRELRVFIVRYETGFRDVLISSVVPGHAKRGEGNPAGFRVCQGPVGWGLDFDRLLSITEAVSLNQLAEVVRDEETEGTDG